MSLSRHPQITEELLSTYLDNEVTEEERSLIEAAMAADPAIAWQVHSLRATIHLLQELPPLALPHAFTLEAIVAEAQAQEVETAREAVAESAVAAARNRPIVVQPYVAPQNNWWQWWQQIWQGGNLYLRNAAAVAFALLVVLFASDAFVVPYPPLAKQTSAPAQIAPNASEVTSNRAVVLTSTTATDSTADAAASSTVATTVLSLGSNIPAETAVAGTATIEAVAVANKTVGASTGESATESPAPTVAIRSLPPRAPQEDTEALDGGAAGSPQQFTQSEGINNTSELRMTTDVAPAGQEQNVQTQSAPPATPSEPVMAASVNGEDEILTTTMVVTPTLAPLAESTETIKETVTVTVTASATLTATPPTRMSPVATNRAALAPLEPVTANREMANTVVDADRWLPWAQMVTALVTVVLGVLWWRSRG